MTSLVKLNQNGQIFFRLLSASQHYSQKNPNRDLVDDKETAEVHLTIVMIVRKNVKDVPVKPSVKKLTLAEEIGKIGKRNVLQATERRQDVFTNVKEIMVAPIHILPKEEVHPLLDQHVSTPNLPDRSVIVRRLNHVIPV